MALRTVVAALLQARCRSINREAPQGANTPAIATSVSSQPQSNRASRDYGRRPQRLRRPRTTFSKRTSAGTSPRTFARANGEISPQRRKPSAKRGCLRTPPLRAKSSSMNPTAPPSRITAIVWHRRGTSSFQSSGGLRTVARRKRSARSWRAPWCGRPAGQPRSTRRRRARRKSSSGLAP